MKSFIFYRSIVDYCESIILLIAIGITGRTLSAVILPQGSTSLYNASDKVIILTSKNFSSTVYQSKTAWLIEFYAGWCGHCQSYANVRLFFFLYSYLN